MSTLIPAKTEATTGEHQLNSKADVSCSSGHDEAGTPSASHSGEAPASAPLARGSAHTPGPWTRERDEGEWSLYSARGYFIGSVCDMNGYLCNDANAQLIEAAPDLLEALRELVHWHGKRARDSDDFLPFEQQELEMQQALRAIAKATGATQ